MKKKKGFFHRMAWSPWKVARTIWPYEEGWGVYQENYINGERVILDTGIPKGQAEEIAKALNDGKPAYQVGKESVKS